MLYAFVDSYEEGRPPRENERDAYGRLIVESRIRAAEIYRTDDKARTWRRVSPRDDFMTQHSGTYGWVFGQIRVDPADENTIYTLGLNLNVSRDAGKTFTVLRGMHADHHGLWIDPVNPSVLYNANDGGFYSSSDAGSTWRFAVSAGGAQFYNVVLDTSAPPWAYGSIQDVGSRRGRVDLGAGRDRAPAVAWGDAPGGEGSHQALDRRDPAIVYSHSFYGNFTREDLAVSRASPQPGQPAAGGRRPGVTPIRPAQEPHAPELRAQWMAPIIVSPHDAATIYAGYQLVMRSSNRGDTWQPISGDLTTDDPATRLLRSSNAVPYQTIVALAESPRARGLIYAGTDDGRLHVTRDGGGTWTELTGNLPTRKWISRVVPSEHRDGTVYVTQRGREEDDFGVYIYRSADFGRTFSSIAANMPAGSVNVVREDPREPARLFAGTDFGAFVSTDAGTRWHVLGGNLPSVQVSDFQYQARDQVIVLSTYGRGVWAMDARSIE